MQITRRGFLKLSGATAIGATLAKFGVTLTGCQKYAGEPELRIRYATESTTICPYDATGCGFIVAVEGGTVINIEGDPDHPINRGGACSKGASLAQLRTVDGKLNPRRLTQVLYRRPGGTEWMPKSWDWAIEQIARNIKRARDAAWVEKDESGYSVNRTEGLASVGGAALDNEECYLLVKALRSLGMVYIEHQARI